MKQTLIRYKTKAELADQNAELIEGVFAELKAKRPAGVRYLSLRLEDDMFIHFVESTAVDGAARCRNWRLFRRFSAESANAALNRRSAALPSSGTMECWTTLDEAETIAGREAG